MDLFTSASFSGETPCLYVMSGDNQFAPATPERVLEVGASYLASRVGTGDVMSSPGAVKDFLRFRIGALEYEVFGVMFLDAQNRLIEPKEMFRGTINQANIYPREVVKEALRLNAVGVIFYHNHPSGHLTPSRADESATQSLKSALALVEVKVLDHIIVGPSGTLSFAEGGYL